MTAFELNGGYWMRPDAINNSAVAVGRMDGRAFLWEDGNTFDLTHLVDRPANTILRWATDINNMGFVCGRGTIGMDPVSYVLIPTSIAE